MSIYLFNFSFVALQFIDLWRAYCCTIYQGELILGTNMLNLRSSISCQTIFYRKPIHSRPIWKVIFLWPQSHQDCPTIKYDMAKISIKIRGNKFDTLRHGKAWTRICKLVFRSQNWNKLTFFDLNHTRTALQQSATWLYSH